MIVVRHGRALVDRNEDPHSWPLDPGAVHEITAIAGALPSLPVVCSDMQRAIGTASYSGRPVVDARLAEIDRPWSDDLTASIARYFAGDAVDGWEPQLAARVRFAAAVADHGEAIYVSHGTVMTLYLSSVVADFTPFEFWQALPSPSAWHVSEGRVAPLA
jgi:broad specificity phosphatase PhoE